MMVEICLARERSLSQKRMGEVFEITAQNSKDGSLWLDMETKSKQQHNVFVEGCSIGISNKSKAIHSPNLSRIWQVLPCTEERC